MISSVMLLLMEQEERSQVRMAMPAVLKALTAFMDLMEPADSMEEPIVRKNGNGYQEFHFEGGDMGDIFENFFGGGFKKSGFQNDFKQTGGFGK